MDKQFESLNVIEARIIGSLIEKEITTPEYYPLTLNSLTSACNQKSNREPVVSYDEKLIYRSVESLRDKGLVCRVTGSEIRVPKYRQTFTEKMNFSLPQTAVITVLLLRGPQTLGEIKNRSNRIYNFSNLEEVEKIISDLMEEGNNQLICKLPRQAGMKESRYAHLLCGEVNAENDNRKKIVEKAAASVMADEIRLKSIEEEVAAVKSELNLLKKTFHEFKKQFE